MDQDLASKLKERSRKVDEVNWLQPNNWYEQDALLGFKMVGGAEREMGINVNMCKFGHEVHITHII